MITLLPVDYVCGIYLWITKHLTTLWRTASANRIVPVGFHHIRMPNDRVTLFREHMPCDFQWACRPFCEVDDMSYTRCHAAKEGGKYPWIRGDHWVVLNKFFTRHGDQRISSVISMGLFSLSLPVNCILTNASQWSLWRANHHQRYFGLIHYTCYHLVIVFSL